MKYLIWLLVILLGLWVWRRARQTPRSRPPSTAPEKSAPDAMCRCAHCGLHLPLDEAVRGERGLYCSTAHRNAAADRNPL